MIGREKIRASWDRMRNIPGLGRNLVTLTVLVALGIGSAAYILSNYSITWPWQDRSTVQMDFSKGPGLVASGGQEVRIAGVKVGTVSAAVAQTDGVRVTVDLDPGHPVYANAHAELKSKTPLNDPYIALEPGGSPAPVLPTDGSGVIPVSQTTRLIQPFEVLNNLDTRTREALTSLVNQADVGLKDAPQTLPGGLNSVTDALDTLQPVADQLQTRRQTIQTLVTDLSEISTAAGRDDGRLAGLVASLQTTLSTIANRDQELGATLDQLPGLGDDLRHALGSVNNLTTQLNPTLDDLHDASEALPPALSKLTDTLQDAKPVVVAAGPVVEKARPVVGDLRPLVSDVDASLGDLKQTTRLLPNATAQIVPWLPNLQAFIYQTSSAFSLQDGNGGYGRAQVFVNASNPTGGLGTGATGSPSTAPGSPTPAPAGQPSTQQTGNGN